MNESIAFVADSADAGARLDVVLSRKLERSRSLCARMIRAGRVTVDGRAAKPAHLVTTGERIEAGLLAPAESRAAPEDIPIRIVYDDPDLCVIDKPAGMATHPAPGSAGGTLVNALLAMLGPLPSTGGALRPGIVHRLDKDTSGLLVVAKSDRAMRALSAALAARRIKRQYDALVWGIPADARGAIDAPLARDPAQRTKFSVQPGGRRAVTHYRVVEAFERCALLEVELETGRTHQIRVHCAAIGHPIVGDKAYGGRRPDLGMKRQALHAARLQFKHPVSGEQLAFVSSWPADFAELVERLRTERLG